MKTQEQGATLHALPSNTWEYCNIPSWGVRKFLHEGVRAKRCPPPLSDQHLCPSTAAWREISDLTKAEGYVWHAEEAACSSQQCQSTKKNRFKLIFLWSWVWLTLRLSCMDDFFFFVVVITCTFTAERKFPHCLCSMTHLCPNRGKNISKRDRLKVKRVWFLGRLLRKRHCRAFFCEAFSHVHRAWNSCQPNQTVFTRWPCHTGEKCEAGSPGELPCLSANRLSLNFLR